MDKSWMKIRDRRDTAYQDGVKQFLEFSYAHIEPGKMIQCPCVRCNNVDFQTRENVEADLYYYGIVKGYTPWIHHGEDFESSTDDDDDDDDLNEPDEEDEDGRDDMQEMIHERYIGTGLK